MDTEKMTFHNTRNNQPKKKPDDPTAGHIARTAVAVEYAAYAVRETSTLIHTMLSELHDSKIWSLIIRKNTGPKTPDST